MEASRSRRCRLLEASTSTSFRSRSSRSCAVPSIHASGCWRRRMGYPLRLGVTRGRDGLRAGRSEAQSGIGILLAEGSEHDPGLALVGPMEEPRDGPRDPQGARSSRARPHDDRVPTAVAATVGVGTLAEEVERRLQEYPQHFEAWPCSAAPVNRPGESASQDVGVARGRDGGFICTRAPVLKKVGSNILMDETVHEMDRWSQDQPAERLRDGKAPAPGHGRASFIPLE